MGQNVPQIDPFDPKSIFEERLEVETWDVTHFDCNIYFPIRVSHNGANSNINVDIVQNFP